MRRRPGTGFRNSNTHRLSCLKSVHILQIFQWIVARLVGMDLRSRFGSYLLVDLLLGVGAMGGGLSRLVVTEL